MKNKSLLCQILSVSVVMFNLLTIGLGQTYENYGNEIIVIYSKIFLIYVQIHWMGITITLIVTKKSRRKMN